MVQNFIILIVINFVVLKFNFRLLDPIINFKTYISGLAQLGIFYLAFKNRQVSAFDLARGLSVEIGESVTDQTV